MENKININEFYLDFYKCINKIIYKIHGDQNISNYLFHCKYLELNNNKQYTIPLTLCLGGGAYTAYSKIFEKWTPVSFVNNASYTKTQVDIIEERCRI